MAETLLQFSNPVASTDGTEYEARACGNEAPDGMWQGWIEFVPLRGAAPVRSPRETTQPNHAALVYWASGLTAVYLEGALSRALAEPVSFAPPVQPQPSIFNEPARSTVTTPASPASSRTPPAQEP